ncbi:MAG: hypothetical protein H6887_06575 [Hoeflea sp.]|nr:hypothetical protein [Hoeflea sp.]
MADIDGAGKNHTPGMPIRMHPRLREESSEAGFFLGCGIGKPHISAATQAARANATTIERELMAEGLIDPELYYRWVAGELGLAYVAEIDPDEVIRLPSMDVLLQRDGPLRLSRGGGQITVITPEARQLDDHRRRLADMPGLRDSLAVASPATIRKAVWQAGADDRVRRITFELDQDRRDASARRVMTGPQGFLMGMAVYLFATASCCGPSPPSRSAAPWPRSPAQSISRFRGMAVAKAQARPQAQRLRRICRQRATRQGDPDMHGDKKRAA